MPWQPTPPKKLFTLTWAHYYLKWGNVSYSSAGELSPLLNDPYFQTIGAGTQIFLCGGRGYIMGQGTQHATDGERKNGVPTESAGTLMLQGDLKKMDSNYLRGGNHA